MLSLVQIVCVWGHFGFPALPRGFTALLFLFTAALEDAGTCPGPGPGQEPLSAVLQPQRQAAAAWGREGREGREGKEGMSAQRSCRKGFSQQLFATLQGAAEAAH